MRRTDPIKISRKGRKARQAELNKWKENFDAGFDSLGYFSFPTFASLACFARDSYQSCSKTTRADRAACELARRMLDYS
jgi:hypothetical protein